MGDLRGLITVLLLILFVALWAWTWSRKQKSQFDEAARMPLEDDDKPPQKDTERMK
ncbi:MAG TPA: cbb3-type cytochrome c oxidase subunit 3 [Woeseiaceae bacterium]|nr:cbb3-type cytochrome c oxidase subunit 3 [Woeseiaceae bacterium]